MAEVERLKQALRDAANANGAPIPDYYNPLYQIEKYQERSKAVAEIIADALKGTE